MSEVNENASAVISADTGENGEDGAGEQMPLGQRPLGEITRENVEVFVDGEREPAFDDDGVAEVVWKSYQLAKEYLEQNSWLLDWQAVDYYYQNQNNDRWLRPADGRPVRISRYIIAKNSNTMDNQVHRGIWGNQKPFTLMPEGPEEESSELLMEAWTHLVWVLMKRAKAEYNFGLAGECSRLQGTGILQPGWEERPVTKKRRKRKVPEPKITTPLGGEQSISTEQSDEFKEVVETTVESWPFLNYRRLGFTFFDPQWSTPNAPEESASYVIDADYVDFRDLQQLRKLPCYQKIPDDETLIKFFLENPQTGNVAPSMLAQGLSDSQSSLAMHAAGEWKNRGENPFTAKLLLLTMWTEERAQAILCYEGRKLTIRNDEHGMGDHALHYTFNWWNVPSSGWGMGIGKLNLDDQRMETGILNEVLKMIGMWFNTPLLTARGQNAPTQNIVAGLGTILQVDTPDGDVRKAMMYIDKPQIPAEAWKVMDVALHGGEDLVGANSTTVQGNLGGPGSSAMRTATGVNRVGGKADENVAKPVLYESWALERFIYFLIDMVRLKMPLQEIRQILAKKYSKAIIAQIDLEDFLNAEFTVNVLAGQKMMAKASMLQMIPLIEQILQQPQLLQGLHDTGRTVDFSSIMDLYIRLSELDGNEFSFFREMTPQEAQQYKQNSPGAQKLQAQLMVEKQRGANRLQEVEARGAVELQNSLTERAAERSDGAIPLEQAFGRAERNSDVKMLQEGIEG